ncbi:hypothetical protein ACROYT_G007289 [Oculina patagonica]
MAERNTHDAKNMLEFGTASMYVISKRGLQTEPLVHSKEADSKVFLDKTVFSGKKVNFSRTRAIDFSWKEVANEPDQADKKIRILDLNGLAVDGSMKRPVCPEKTRSLAGAMSQPELLNRPYMCFKATRVNDMKQVVNEGNLPVPSLSTICHFSFDGYKKNSKEDFEKKTKKELEDKTGKMRQPYGHYVDSRPSEPTLGNSKDLTDVTTDTKKQDGDSENSSSGPPHGNIAVGGKNPDRPGKCYLKRIFYPKGNNYFKPSNPRYLPQISTKAETDHSAAINPGKHAKSDSPNTETTQQNNSNTRESNKLLLPLNINVLKNSEKHKHHLKSIVKLPTVVDKRTGQVHLSLEAVAFEQSDYNKWSRRQKRIRPENGIKSCFSFPLITKSGK